MVWCNRIGCFTLSHGSAAVGVSLLLFSSEPMIRLHLGGWSAREQASLLHGAHLQEGWMCFITWSSIPKAVMRNHAALPSLEKCTYDMHSDIWNITIGSSGKSSNTYALSYFTELNCTAFISKNEVYYDPMCCVSPAAALNIFMNVQPFDDTEIRIVIYLLIYWTASTIIEGCRQPRGHRLNTPGSVFCTECYVLSCTWFSCMLFLKWQWATVWLTDPSHDIVYLSWFV